MSLSNYTAKSLSILFRLILIIYGIIIIFNNNMVLDKYLYIIFILPYFTIYFKTLFRDGIFSKIRLLNDYIFITIILYGLDLNFLNLIFLSLPIINAQNHSGEKRSFLLYVFYIFSYFIINDLNWSWSFIIVVFSLLIINSISNLRFQYFKNISKLNEQIEKFLERDLHINKTYKIYKSLIPTINSLNIFIPKPNLTQILCFRISDSRIYLENSSDFIWSYSVEKEILLRIHSDPDKEYLSSIPITINGTLQQNNFFILNKTITSEYLFIFILDRNTILKVSTIYLKRILHSITNRIARVVNLENSLKAENKIMLHDFRNKYFQIQNSEKAMHFIRNRFNTLDNFIEMSKDNINGNMDLEDLEIYKIELVRLERNYNILMERVKSILNKSDKPFSATKLEEKSINYTFNLIREIWLDYFQDFNFEVKFNFNLNEKNTIKINYDGLYILISDWISNLKKYSIADEKVIFDETKDSFLVVFQNKFSLDSKPEIESLMTDFNSKERDKILQRTSHGVLIMRSILEEMNIIGQIKIIEDMLILELTIKKEKNENSNI